MNGILTSGRSITGRVTKGAIAVVLAISLVQGCILSQKKILDVYSDIFAISLGVETPLITLGFPNPYTIPQGRIIFKGRFKEAPLPPSAINVILRLLNPAGGVVNTWTFPLNVKQNGKIRKQSFQFPALAILAGYSLAWFLLAVDGPPGAMIEGKTRMSVSYKVDK